MAGIDNNTVLYLRGDSFTDLSPNPKTITNNGVTISDNCLEFGTAKRLIIGSSSEFAFGSGDFTVEVDAYLTAYSESDIFVSNNNFKDFYFNVSKGNSKLRFDATYDPHYSENTVPLNTWNHLCVTRKDGIVYLFINGKLEFTGTNNSAIAMTSPRIGYHDDYPEDKITGKLKNIRISNIARYTEDFTPPTQPFNSININVTNKTFSQIDFNVTKLGQETINNVEVLVNNIVSETYTDNFDNLTYNIDNSLCAIGNNNITIRVTYDDNYVEEEVLTHTVAVNNLPTSSSLKDVIDRLEILNNVIETQKNNLKNILVGKNVEVAEEEDKLSSLIDKVGLLGDYYDDKLYLYKDGVFKNYNHSILKIGNVYGNSALNNNYINLKINTTSSSQWSYIGLSSTNTVDISDYNKLKVKVKYNKFTPNGSSSIETLATLRKENSLDTDKVASIKVTSMTVDKEYTYSLDISNLTGNYVCQFVIGAYMVVSNIDVNIYQMWLEK